jgi:hypothetical protein
MAEESNEERDNPASLWQAVAKAFGPLHDQPVLALSLAFGMLVVGAVSLMETRGVDRTVLISVLGVLLLIYVIGLVTTRGTKRGPAGSGAEAAESVAAKPSAAQLGGTSLKMTVGTGAKVTARDSMNVERAADGGPSEAELEVGDLGEADLTNVMNQKTQADNA